MKSGQAWGLLVLRVVVGLIFHVHGDQKLAHMGIAKVTGMMEHFRIPLPHAAAILVTYLEFIGGLLLIAGIGTRLLALLFAIEMAVVVFWVKLHSGLLGFDFELLLMAASLCLALTGAGAISVDRLFSRRKMA